MSGAGCYQGLTRGEIAERVQAKREEVLRLRACGWTLARIAGLYGVSRQRVWALANRVHGRRRRS